MYFYDVDRNYIDFLKTVDTRIPNFNYINNNKFVCGIVLNINNCNYYAPISSNKKIQKTSIAICDKGEIISSIRFSFMFPIPENCCCIKDFKRIEDKNYVKLLQKELKYCRNKKEQIFKKAMYVYDRTVNKKDTAFINRCCNFKLLEQACHEYTLNKTAEITPAPELDRKELAITNNLETDKNIRPSVKDKITAKKAERTQQSKGAVPKSSITQNQTKSKNNKEYKAI